MLDDLGSRKREFVELLPLLFLVNHPLLPGYISKEIPPGSLIMPRRRARLRPPENSHAVSITSIGCYFFFLLKFFLMGRAGTLAYSKTSDLDV
ncbi:MAG: hypothetical protein ACU84Q_11930 [Gammaproteobacteria bacterium]